MIIRRWPAVSAIAFFALFGTILPVTFGVVAGIPDPIFQDEYCYLLGADTFAHGRLTNPSPRLPEFFETEHVVVVPTYQSKYPPGQALLLAVGQVVFGHPIWGVWLSCGLFAGALCWMLQAWSRRECAFAVTLLACATLGTSTYWAQSYWGGMVAATGAALVFGGGRRAFRSASVSAGILTGIGLVILANSRPYEGFLASIPAAALVVRSVVMRPCETRRRPTSFIVSLILVLTMGAGVMAVYNRAVTGNYRRLPYALHVEQYLYRGLFIFSPERQPTREPVERVRSFYENLGRDRTAGPLGLIAQAGRNFAVRLPVSVPAAFGFISAPRREREPYRGVTLWLVLLLSFYPAITARQIKGIALTAAVVECLVWLYVPLYPWALAAPVAGGWALVVYRVARRNRWMWFVAGTVALVLVGQALMWWWAPHYVSPIVPLVLVAVAIALDEAWRAPESQARATIRASSMMVLAIYLGVTIIAQATELTHPHPASTNRIATRGDVQHRLERTGGAHLVFVHYEPGYSPHQEWVYNEADLDRARVIFAHDLGDDRDAALLAAYGGRSAWRLDVAPRQVTLEPYAPSRRD